MPSASRSFSSLDLLAQVGPELVEGVELGGRLGELVVGGGQLLRLDLLDQDLEVHGSVPPAPVAERVGERRGELEDVAGLRARQLLVELGPELAGPDPVR